MGEQTIVFGAITAIGTPNLTNMTVEVTVDPEPDLTDSDDRFVPGTLTDTATTFPITDNSGDGTSVTVQIRYQGGVLLLPRVGDVNLRDDDALLNGQDVPMPDTTEVGNAMHQAFVRVFYDVGDQNTNVTFVRNVEGTGVVSAQDWDSASSNAASYWVAYLLGAFQGPIGEDCDPNTEAVDDPNTPAAGGCTLGIASFSSGGGIIFKETIHDASLIFPFSEVDGERATVVHELGHVMARSGLEPVTMWDQVLSGPIRYTAAYLDLIRDALSPAS